MTRLSPTRMLLCPIVALLLVTSTTTAIAKKNELRGTNCQQQPTTTGNNYNVHGGKSKTHRCTVNRTAFNPKFVEGDIIDIDFGPGRRYTCQSERGRRAAGGSSSAASASCILTVDNNNNATSSAGINIASSGVGLFGKSNAVMGDMNIITRGKNSRGEDNIFGSTSVNGEICDISPDATGKNIVVECNPESAYPPEADAVESGASM